MSYILIFSAALFASVAGASSACARYLIDEPFFSRAPNPEDTVTRLVAERGWDTSILIGPTSVRTRLDRAFARHLITRFGAFTADAPREVEARFRRAEYVVTREPDEIMSIRSKRSMVPIFEWQARPDDRVLSPDEVLNDPAPKGDAWLVLDPDIGLRMLAQLIDHECVASDRKKLLEEMELRVKYLERVRNSFNRRNQGRWAVTRDYTQQSRTPPPGDLLH